MANTDSHRRIITTPNQVGEILRARRKARRISQHDLAAKVAISQGRLSMLEGNTEGLTLGRLITLANLLGLEIVIQERTETSIPKTEW